MTATAGTDYTQAQLKYDLIFENCYGSELLVSGLELCAGSNVLREVILKNNGTKNQTFNLSTTADFITLPSEITVDANSSKTVTLEINVPSTIDSSYILTAKSDNAELTRTMASVLLPTDVFLLYSLYVILFSLLQ